MNRKLASLRSPDKEEDNNFMHGTKIAFSEKRLQCYTASLTRNEKQETILTSSSGNQYRFVESIKRSIYGQVVKAEIVASSRHLYSPTRSRGCSISTYASDDTMDLSLVMDDEDEHPERLFQEPESKKFVAIKIYSRTKMNSPFHKSCKENPCMELEISQFVADHQQYLLGSIESCINEEYLFNVMPYVPHPELFDYLAENSRFQEDNAKKIMKQVLQGLHFLHRHHIAHRDLSLENILYDPCTQRSMIIDYGLGIMTDTATTDINTLKNTSCPSTLVPNIFTGKVTYLPPEIIAGTAMVDPFAADIWALGICLLYLLLGFPPLVQAHPSDLRFVFLQTGRLPELLSQWNVSISSQTLHFVEFLLECDPLKRPTIDEVLAHPWLQY